MSGISSYDVYKKINFGKRKARQKAVVVQYDPITPTEHSAEEKKSARRIWSAREEKYRR